ncbi:protein MpHDAC1 [Marchantia polymorpha subsp. ruderalis]|uniref:Histone deacetylase domain-containing protein n=2 Tax=Marchantia polymorpha TaxID=3197 RepID=A0AAF6AKA0_MARPO|nr:hypothetical protein MARPO_0029s0117 [Marchantia polymorpha]BBM96870.1 hypothetical protein Mp_1g01300 [Marchantia polymorpha subsp. ruderalis]|eukprot:PTQ42614.1 hypothetical protein MARPO_0029s0117 [Marchantia polymorpha]
MAAARGVMKASANPGLGLGLGPGVLRQRLAPTFGIHENIAGTSTFQRGYSVPKLSSFSAKWGDNNSYSKSGSLFDGANLSPLSGQSRSKRELLLPVPTLVDSKVIFSAAPAYGHNKEGHPECKARVSAIMKALDQAGLADESRAKEILRLDVKNMASVEEVATVHNMSYVKGLREIMDKAREEKLILLDSTGPTYATENTYREAMMGAGASLAVLDHVVAASRETSTPPVGFALVRPPGHHAIATRPMGFCVFGNVAVAARHAQRVHGLQRVFIIDFDVHHGNGTNDIFYEDPNVYYLSTHQVGGFPGTGKIDEVGEGKGEGTTLNLPLPGGSGDEAMSAVFDEVIVPAAQRFKPDIILVSAGYDAHYLDELAGLQFTTGTYFRLASHIKQLAGDLCAGRCCFFLEGGYDLKALSNSVVESFRAFVGDKSMAHRLDNPAVLYDEPSILVRQVIDEVRSIHSL